MILDTSVLFEILISKKEDFTHLLANQNIFLTDLIYFEFGNLILSRTKNPLLVYETLKLLDSFPTFTVLVHTSEEKSLGLEMMKKYADQGLSIVDCVTLAQATKHKLEVYTLDRRMSFVAGVGVRVL